MTLQRLTAAMPCCAKDNAEATRVLSMQDLHLLFPGLPGVRTPHRKKGKPGNSCNKDCHQLVNHRESVLFIGT